MQFFLNGEIVSTELQDPYDFTFQLTAEVAYVLKAMVTTDLGAYESSAKVVWLEPGLYTAVASGVGGQAGIALVEAYEID